MSEKLDEKTSSKSESKSDSAKDSEKEPLFSTENPPKMATSAIMSAPVEKKPFSVLLALAAGCAVSLALAILFLILWLSANAKVVQLERDVADHKTTIVNLKNQINELDK